jgi:hypothetical protein
MKDCSSDSQTGKTNSTNPSRISGRDASTLLLMIPQRLSIGFRSGDPAGQVGNTVAYALR